MVQMIYSASEKELKMRSITDQLEESVKQDKRDIVPTGTVVR